MPNNNNPNQSGKGPANTAASVGAEHLPLGITNALNRAGTDTQAARQLRDRQAAIEENDLFIAGRQYPGQFDNTEMGSGIAKLEAEHARIIKRQEIIEGSHRARTISTVTTNINKSFSSSATNGQVESRLSSPEIQKAILQQAGSMSPQEVHHHMRTSQMRLSNYEQELHGIAQNKLVDRFGEVDPDQKKRMNAIYGQREEELNRRATLHGISKFHKEQGKDPMSQTLDILKTQTSAMGSIKSGGAGANEAQTFLDTLEKLNKVVDNTSKEFKDLSDSLDKAKEAYDNAASAGPKVGGLTAKGWGVVGAVGDIAQTIGRGITTMGVDHRIADRGNIANMAGLANSKYEMYKAARHGDIASQLSMSNWGASQRFGKQIKHTSQVGETTEAVGGLLSTAAKAAGAAILAKAAVGAAATGVGLPVAALLGVGAIGLGVSAATDAASAGSSLGRGIKSGQNYVAGVTSDMEARRQVNAVPAAQMQGLRDFYVGAGSVAMGMGSKGEGFLKQMTDTGDSETVRLMKAKNGDTVNEGILGRMAKAGLSPEQMVEMANLGNKTVGSQFSTNQVFAGRKYEKAGLGSMQDNMQRMGQLSMAGSNNPQSGLESVMASAMTKGLDNSKALGMMVDNTAALVESGVGARFGVDTASVTAAALASYATGDLNENKEFALKRAMTAEGVARSSETNVSTTFSGMVNTSRLGDRLGFNTAQQLNAGKVESATWKTISEAKNANDLLQDLSLGNVNLRGPNKGKVRTNEEAQALAREMLDLKADQRIEGAGIANALHGGVSNELRKSLKAGTEIDRNDPMYNEMAANANMMGLTPQEYQKQSRSGFLSADSKDKLNGKLNPDASAPQTAQEKLDALKNSGNKQLSESAMSAAKSLDQFGGALTQFLKMTKDQEVGGVEKETEASTSAGKAADDFRLGAEKFGPAVDKLDAVLNNIISKSGMKIPVPTDPRTQQTGSDRQKSK